MIKTKPKTNIEGKVCVTYGHFFHSFFFFFLNYLERNIRCLEFLSNLPNKGKVRKKIYKHTCTGNLSF